jgi:hypothetical protein
MTRARAVRRLLWAGLVLAGCGSGAAPTAQLSHAASRRGPANKSAPKSAPNAAAVPPGGSQRCTEVYCVPQPVPRRLASFAPRS